MNLIIDIGNTRVKAGLFLNKTMVDHWLGIELDQLIDFLKDKPIKKTIICSVNNRFEHIIEYIRNRYTTHFFSHTSPLPITNKYATPTTLGVDRLAAVVGAFQSYPEQHNLVIDLGTCITYDFITCNGDYLGGGISPGMLLRLRAMHEFTNALPQVTLTEKPSFIGDSTKSCMQSGVYYGIKHEIEGNIREYREKFGQINVIFCGGDANFFESSLKATIFVNQYLTLIGLNKILEGI